MTDDPPRKDRVLAALGYAGPICVFVYLYAKNDFAKKHGKQGLSVLVLQVVGFVVIDLFRPVIGQWVYLGWGVWLFLTAVLQIALAVGALAGKAGEFKYIPK
jgi:hypothetical protein